MADGDSDDSGDRLEAYALSDVASLESHRSQWDRLVQASPVAMVAQTYAYAAAGWATRQAAADSLFVVVVYAGERLVAVWPLYVAKRGVLRIVRLLGCGGREEYADPLIAADCRRPDLVARELYRLATDAGDLLEAYNLPSGSPLLKVLRADSRLRQGGVMASPTIHLSSGESWDAWIAAKSRSFRQGLRADRKTLSAEGSLSFREVAAGDANDFVDWLFTTKRAWLDRRRMGANWLREPLTAAFYKQLVGREESGVLGFALDLDGRPIAGGICLAGKSSLEFYLTAFDPAFSKFSPGNLLLEELVRWCLPRGLDFDFRLTTDAYKLRWSDRMAQFAYYNVACTKLGALAVWRLQMADAWRDVKRSLKRLLRR